MVRIVVRKRRGSGPLTKGQASRIFELLPSGPYLYSPKGVAKAVGLAPKSVQAEFERRVATGKMRKLPVAKLKLGSHRELLEFSETLGKNLHVEASRYLYQKL